MSTYHDLKNAAAWLDVSDRGKIRITGEDRKRLMHAMTTNHVQQLEPGQGLYALFLNGQGRILGDVEIFAQQEALLVDVAPELAQKIFAHLDHYIIADDAELEDLTETWFAIQVEGPNSIEAVRHAFGTSPEAPYGLVECEDLVMMRVSLVGGDGVRICGPADRKQAVVDKLGLPQSDAEAIDLVRIENRTPKYGVDFSEANIPQETGLMRALHFSKGCYLGQEIVERVRSRGHVNKQLTYFELDQPVPLGTKLLAAGKEVGELTSVAAIPDGPVVAIGINRAEHNQIGQLVDTTSDAKAKVVGLIS